MSDRFQYDDDGRSLDEIVLTGVTLHLERMSHHGWWMSAHDPATGDRVALHWTATREPVVEREGFDRVETVIRGPLLYHADGSWSDRRADHRCEVDAPAHRRCRCECGATRKAPAAVHPHPRPEHESNEESES